MGLLTGLLSPLFDFLKCLALWLVGALLAGLITLLNFLLVPLAALAQLGLSLLPSVTLSPASIPSLGGAMGVVDYFLPVALLLSTASVVLTVRLSLPLVRLLLRWVKGVA